MSASSNHSQGQFNGNVKQKMVPSTSKNKVKSLNKQPKQQSRSIDDDLVSKEKDQKEQEQLSNVSEMKSSESPEVELISKKQPPAPEDVTNLNIVPIGTPTAREDSKFFLHRLGSFFSNQRSETEKELKEFEREENEAI